MKKIVFSLFVMGIISGNVYAASEYGAGLPWEQHERYPEGLGGIQIMEDYTGEGRSFDMPEGITSLDLLRLQEEPGWRNRLKEEQAGWKDRLKDFGVISEPDADIVSPGAPPPPPPPGPAPSAESLRPKQVRIIIDKKGRASEGERKSEGKEPEGHKEALERAVKERQLKPVSGRVLGEKSERPEKPKDLIMELARRQRALRERAEERARAAEEVDIQREEKRQQEQLEEKRRQQENVFGDTFDRLKQLGARGSADDAEGDDDDYWDND